MPTHEQRVTKLGNRKTDAAQRGLSRLPSSDASVTLLCRTRRVHTGTRVSAWLPALQQHALHSAAQQHVVELRTRRPSAPQGAGGRSIVPEVQVLRAATARETGKDDKPEQRGPGFTEVDVIGEVPPSRKYLHPGRREHALRHRRARKHLGDLINDAERGRNFEGGSESTRHTVTQLNQPIQLREIG